MNSHFFSRLAADNIRKNKMTYIPYLLTCVLTVAMFYIVKSLSLNPGLETMIGFDVLTYLLFLGSRIIGIFSLIFLFYTNSFLIRRRQKEFGVFNILGMEKRHLAKTLAIETLYVALISFAGGLICGIALDKAMFLLIQKIIGGKVSLGFFISPEAIKETVLLFSGIFLLIFAYSVFKNRVSNPIQLLREGLAGEKEPKVKVLRAVLGTACIAVGYTISFTVKNPIASISLFFFAVLFVIAGTYMLFTAGSIAFLKLLRKNKGYYYKTNHFVSISGLIYRMKQNAVGLSNICILSTMVLVTVSSTSSLMIGMEDVIRSRYPNDFCIHSGEPDVEKSREAFDEVRRLQKESGLQKTAETKYSFLGFLSLRQDDEFSVADTVTVQNAGALTDLVILPLSDYIALTGKQETLDADEILLYCVRTDYEHPSLKILGRTYKIKEHLDEFMQDGLYAADIASCMYMVVKDSELRSLDALQRGALGDGAARIRYYYGFDLKGSDEAQAALYETILQALSEREFNGRIESRSEERIAIAGMYGGLFFIGIFLGLLFVMATVLIIYYKQISEGYDDKKRFEIMQKVGLSRQEARTSIRSQVLTVFFLPLAVAGIHAAAAFPLVRRILTIFNLNNTGLFIACTASCFLAFAIAYALIYFLTARTYDKIVNGNA